MYVHITNTCLIFYIALGKSDRTNQRLLRGAFQKSIITSLKAINPCLLSVSIDLN